MVLDIETTGLGRDDRIIEIAMIKLNYDFRPIDQFHSYINPLKDTGPVHVHNITNDMVEHAPVFPELADQVLSFLSDETTIVAHNIDFDMKFIKRELRKIEAIGEHHRFRTFCTLKTARQYFNFGSNKLEDLCTHFKIVNRKAHSAMGDTLATAELLERMLKVLGKRVKGEPIELLRDLTVTY